jgi:AcrR family transcriptional regulator
MAVSKQKSASVPHLRADRTKQDQRVVRTRIRIDAAFVELLHRRAYGNIRVGDVTRKAGVGRATFYAHYLAKDDLLRSQFDRIVAPMLVRSPADPRLLDASALLAHIQTAPRLYSALTGPDAGTAPRVLRDCYEARVRQLLQTDDRNTAPRGTGFGFGLDLAVVARFVASTLVTIVECWLQQGAKETPQQVQAIFSTLVGPGIRAWIPV